MNSVATIIFSPRLSGCAISGNIRTEQRLKVVNITAVIQGVGYVT
jgi:hypothetical protein